MRRFSLHAVLLVLALVFQTVASGAGMAAMSANAGPGEHCDRVSTTEQRAPGDTDKRKHDCLSCQACSSVGPAASFSAFAAHALVLPVVTRVELPLCAGLAPEASCAAAHRARAPPRAFS